MPLKGTYSVHGVERGLQLGDAGWCSVLALPSRFLGSAPLVANAAGSVPLGDFNFQSTRPLQMWDLQFGLALRQEAVYVVHGE